MSDLIDRLRAVPFVGFIYEGQAGQEDPSICTEAADEIERLRKALVWISENSHAHQSSIASVARTAFAEGGKANDKSEPR
jgi:hypothetical protein